MHNSKNTDFSINLGAIANNEAQLSQTTYQMIYISISNIMSLYTDSPIIDAISDTLQKDYIENIK